MFVDLRFGIAPPFPPRILLFSETFLLPAFASVLTYDAKFKFEANTQKLLKRKESSTFIYPIGRYFVFFDPVKHADYKFERASIARALMFSSGLDDE